MLLKNYRHEHSAVEELYKLTGDRKFILGERVCWAQASKRGHLITAMTFLKSIGFLHSHAGPGRSSRIKDLVRGLQIIMEKIGKNVFRDNAKTFYELVDECWGVRRVVFKEGAAYLRTTFLQTLALILSRHQSFWHGDRLFVDAKLRRKLASFPVNDPQVVNLSGAGGKAWEMLYVLLLNHLNSGRRTNRLKLRDGLDLSNEERLALNGGASETEGGEEEQVAAAS